MEMRRKKGSSLNEATSQTRKTQDVQRISKSSHAEGDHGVPVWGCKDGGKQAGQAGVTSEQNRQEAPRVGCAEPAGAAEELRSPAQLL